MNSTYDRLGCAATAALVLAAEEWPYMVRIQAALADPVREYQSRQPFAFESVTGEPASRPPVQPPA